MFRNKAQNRVRVQITISPYIESQVGSVILGFFYLCVNGNQTAHLDR